MGRGLWFLWGRFLLLATLCSVQSRLGFAQNAPAPSQSDYQNFADLLKHVHTNNEFVQLLESDQKKLLESFKKFGMQTLKELPADTFKNLHQRFYIKFISLKETKEKFEKQIAFLKDKKIALPLSEKKSIVDLDLKIKASQDQVKQARFVIFFTSFEANKALMETLESPTLKALVKNEAEKKAKELADSKRPKLPGTPQESKQDRMNTLEADKLSLTPVDPEFYNTQLGKKLEKDLGGRADFWNYDFDQDELYVVVGKETGKIRVKQKDQSTRIIQTRVGSGYNEIPSDYQGDVAVDINVAKGRFLTGNPADPTLFGEFPTAKEDPSIPEGKVPPTHKKGDGHNHNH